MTPSARRTAMLYDLLHQHDAQESHFPNSYSSRVPPLQLAAAGTVVRANCYAGYYEITTSVLRDLKDRKRRGDLEFVGNRED